jgi:hypothetical protein
MTLNTAKRTSTRMPELAHLAEPRIEFRHGQSLEDPRDGLTLFGPLDDGRPYGIRVGAIGTPDGLARLGRWLDSVQKPVEDRSPSSARAPFPGFEAVFGIPLMASPQVEILITPEEIREALYLKDKHQRVYRTVSLYAERIQRSIREDDEPVDVWFVVEPDEIYQYSRPLSQVDPSKAIDAPRRMSEGRAKKLLRQASLFQEEHDNALPYYHEVNFHNQLKARLLRQLAPIQIVRESTIAYQNFLNSYGSPIRDLGNSQSAIAWNILTTLFYKAGGRPWKLTKVRNGVCYVGLTFKLDRRGDERSACCAAQMFLDSGDGVVFKGAVGPWWNRVRGDFHLSRSAARELVQMAVQAYEQKTGAQPKELFLHGKVRFSDEEWAGFCEGAGPGVHLVGVRIRRSDDLKLFRKGEYPALRGMTYIRDQRTGYLWTNGFVPRLRTYPGREVPWPLLVDVCKGEAAIEVVLRDVLALTKLNYNACIYGDGLPVTLRFADAVGEILTAAPIGELAPLAFKHYI